MTLYCDETKHLTQISIQKSKFIYLMINTILRNYVQDILTFFRHDAFY